ncbi:conserved exported hypothetical protein [Desulfamplus magnetovallimortis]|uniref:Uncharacterized protein n=1 Tax=Desulfamplus magnetovallimortis TaxID=1246637 RepID=A0A1W1H9Z8_9BACT|nr:hypothetical protein [Desulfamplus magnetovallimortis]SLM29314.1 conserved exported hypothetical protein [Desulfamplus magnetovallimortis]
MIKLFFVFFCIAFQIVITPATLLASNELNAEEGIKKIAIIPFTINSENKTPYIQKGIFDMLSSRLSWKDHVVTASLSEIREIISSLHMAGGYPGNEKLENMASASESDYVVYGSLTEFDGAFSLDTIIFNPVSETKSTFSVQAKSIEELISRVEVVAARINMEVFNRKTAALSILEQEENNKKNATENIRTNPEKLMGGTALQDEDDETNKPFWKFWGNGVGNDGEPDSYSQDKTEEDGEKVILLPTEDNDEEDELKKKKPFWQFW